MCVCSPERAEVYFLTVKLPGSCLGDNSCDDGIKPRDQNTKINISLKRPIFYVSCMRRTNQTALISIRMTSPEAYLRGGLCWADGAGEWSDVGQRPASWTGMQPLSQTTVRCRSACSAAIMAPVVSHVRTTDELPHGWSEPETSAVKQQQADEWLCVDGRVQQVIIFRRSADLMSRCTEFHVFNLSLHERETVEKVYVNTGIRIFDRLVWQGSCKGWKKFIFKVRTLPEFKYTVLKELYFLLYFST